MNPLTMYDASRITICLVLTLPHLDQIDKHTLEIAQVDDTIYDNLQDLGDELPDHSPRFVLLSYPLTLVNLL